MLPADAIADGSKACGCLLVSLLMAVDTCWCMPAPAGVPSRSGTRTAALITTPAITRCLLPATLQGHPEFKWQPPRQVQIKGKGTMTTYLLDLKRTKV